MEPLVSVIIPAYNAEQYIEKCLRSFMSQTHTNLEIIVINDGSQDGTVAVLARLAASDPRIQIITQKNHGVSYARNTGLKAANGEYITFADADDYVDEQYVEALLKGIRREDADVSCCGFVLHRPDREITFFEGEAQRIWGQEEALECLITGDLIEPGVWGKMFRKEVLTDVLFNTSIKYNEDFLFGLETFHNSKKVAFVGGAYYHYILHENSATTNAPALKRARDMMAVSEIAVHICSDGRIGELLLKRKNMGYLDNYNSLLYSEEAGTDKLKKEIRNKILTNKQYFRSVRMTKREMFFYYGIVLCPGIYEYVFRGLKQILPDRRTFKI